MFRPVNDDVLLRRGQLLPDYSFITADGSVISLTDFRNRQNVVLLFGHTPLNAAETELLQGLAAVSGELRESETRVLAVTGDLQRSMQFSDAVTMVQLQSHRAPEQPPTAIYVTDKFREIFHLYRIVEGEALPTADDVIGWVKFVAMNCPECHPPEWPADAL